MTDHAASKVKTGKTVKTMKTVNPKNAATTNIVVERGNPTDALVLGQPARVWRGDGAAQHLVVDHVDFVVLPRQVHAVVGDNGTGKTSLLLGILGLLRSTLTVRATTIGYAPQRLTPPPHLPLTIADLCALPPRSRRVDVKEVLDAAGLSDRVPANRALSSLSGGELARVSTALAVLSRPALCLLDEPSASVDAHSRSVIDDLVRRARDDGAGVLLVTHDERQVAALADVVTRLPAAPEPR
jgi:ABC-type Mn2+/Zn2+ transport system ATPase subunit